MLKSVLEYEPFQIGQPRAGYRYRPPATYVFYSDNAGDGVEHLLHPKPQYQELGMRESFLELS
jgi:hypothetical protein